MESVRSASGKKGIKRDMKDGSVLQHQKKKKKKALDGRLKVEKKNADEIIDLEKTRQNLTENSVLMRKKIILPADYV